MNLSAILLAALRDHGARQIFGIPGDFVLPFFRTIEESGILPLYTLSHEPSLGFAADAAARFCGGLGVAAVTYGTGALNMVNAVAQAYAEKSPVVVISGAPGAREMRSGLLLHHQAKTLYSPFAIYREITCDQTRLSEVHDAPVAIARVLASALRESRPVYIELPRDVATAECAPVTALAVETPDPQVLEACANEILERIGRADSPVLLIGVEVRRFGLERKVAELARRLSVPVITTLLGRGLLAENPDAPLIGTYLGVAGEPRVTQMVEQSDALLLLGVIVSDTNFGVSSRRIDMRGAIQAFDGCVVLGDRVYPQIALAAIVDALLVRLPDTGTHRPFEPVRYRHGLQPDEAPVMPNDIAAAINDLMRVRGPMPIAADVGDCLFAAMDIAPTPLVAPGYYASMGFGVPAGLGLQAASGQRPLILVGDGAFQMTGWELGHCPRYGWDPIVIVLNNAGWGMLDAFQPASQFTRMGDWDFADLACHLGGEGTCVRTRAQLKAALERAVAQRGRFHLLDVKIPRGAFSATLSRFVTAMKQVAGAAAATSGS